MNFYTTDVDPVPQKAKEFAANEHQEAMLEGYINSYVIFFERVLNFVHLGYS